MRSMRLILLFVIVAAAILSVAAVGAEMKPTPPANVDLAGIWRINADLSDDPSKAVERKQSDSAGGSSRSPGGTMRRGTGPGGIVIDAGDILDGVFGGGTGSGSSSSSRRTRGGGAGDRPEEDPEPASMRMPLDSFLATQEQFEIAQERDSLTIATVDEKSTCKPADPGKAPVPGGDLGKRRCGWQGSTWVTEITAPNDVVRTNRYELRKNGQQLVMTSEIKGGKSELSGLRIKRVYDRVL
jgi:hypothetical protein